ncbi:hypothetical protein CEE37_13215 [candidate division LCP-89 bacterium B3_LCP]|uniref:Glycosidase n=1 Tax=candidate division LCP-89 bacterium B3_LCP TaxID=2012998 RepID=A0A532USL0_UNCL8|nr:MAG: hypothetical protein CEE37_13215 [candidate division LCP-89 bacterium B3_LCP]
MTLSRNSDNPIVARHDIPNIPPHLSDVSSVFNPGAVKFKDKYLLMLRVQNRGRETYLMMAESLDGVSFTMSNKTVHFDGIESVEETIYHIYDPRITQIDGKYYIVCAMDMDDGCHLGLARTTNFEQFDFMGVLSKKDSRNGVLFPEKVGGKYCMLLRPNEVRLVGGVISGDTIVLSTSDDLLNWGEEKPMASGRLHYWDERIGSGPPPVKTKQGWLHIYHGVAMHFASSNIYQAGAMLLDLDDPSIVKARSRYNILEPRKMYEMVGQVPNVVFPSGMIVENFDPNGFALPDSEVLLYYGAADSSVCLATTTIRELIESCQYV